MVGFRTIAGPALVILVIATLAPTASAQTSWNSQATVQDALTYIAKSTNDAADGRILASEDNKLVTFKAYAFDRNGEADMTDITYTLYAPAGDGAEQTTAAADRGIGNITTKATGQAPKTSGSATGTLVNSTFVDGTTGNGVKTVTVEVTFNYSPTPLVAPKNSTNGVWTMVFTSAGTALSKTTVIVYHTLDAVVGLTDADGGDVEGSDISFGSYTAGSAGTMLAANRLKVTNEDSNDFKVLLQFSDLTSPGLTISRSKIRLTQATVDLVTKAADDPTAGSTGLAADGTYLDNDVYSRTPAESHSYAFALVDLESGLNKILPDGTFGGTLVVDLVPEPIVTYTRYGDNYRPNDAKGATEATDTNIPNGAPNLNGE